MSFTFAGDNLQDVATKKEEAKINRMRQMQEERRSRIFSTKERTIIGDNLQALNQQNQRQKDVGIESK